jgi:hypothetical protein
MKRKMIWVVIGLAVILAVAFSGCSGLTGKDGKAYLTVTSDYSFHASTQSGLGLPSPWYSNTSYAVNAGTWNYKYTQAYYYGYSTYYGYYLYYLNALPSGYSYWAETSYVSNATAAYDAYAYGDYFTESITIATNPGKFLSNGADRNYTLDLAWDPADNTVSYNGVALPSDTVLDNAEKTVKIFKGAVDTITLTLDKTAPKSGAADTGAWSVKAADSSAPTLGSKAIIR